MTKSVEPFEASWLRIERAASHKKTLAEMWNSYIDQEPHYFDLDDRGKGVFVLRVMEEFPPPDEMALVMGEWLYNLRCALDYVVYDTAVCISGKAKPPGHGQLQFPVYGTAEQWADNLYRLKPLGSHHRDLLEKTQPYRHADPDTSALGWLNSLARVDRHRRLTVQTSYMAELKPIIEIPQGCTATLQFGDRVIGPSGIAEIARFKITPWKEGWEVRANPRTGIDPEIAEWAVSPFWSRIQYNERLNMVRVLVESMIVTFEYDCLGSSRKAHLLTDEFRAECDARRQPQKPIVGGKVATRWTQQVPGSLTTDPQPMPPPPVR